jgi:hypothetical protein
MTEYLLNFKNGEWRKYTGISQEFIDTLARLLALNPALRGDTEYLLNQDPFVRGTVDVATSEVDF